MKTRMTDRRGSAALLAVTMVGLAGVMIAALASLFAAEARRTRDAAAEAQLRQLLVAGASLAFECVRAATPIAADTAIQPPASLVIDNARVTMRLLPPADVDTARVEVHAVLGEREMSQTLRFVRRDAGWSLAGATLYR